MVAIGRAMMSNPKILMLDEPSLGIAPKIVSEIAQAIKRLNIETGISVILAEQNARLALKMSDDAYVFEQGLVIRSGSGQELLNDPRVPALAAEWNTTRSAAALGLWEPMLDGAVVAIGNAPTALFHLLEMLIDGAPRPAAIVGCPVGFIGAAESKQALIDLERDHGIAVPFVTVTGRRGGSAMTSSALNALAQDEE